jgi:hypothetical protein
MTDDDREDLILELLTEFQQSVGATTDEQTFAFKAGARAALVTMADRAAHSRS